MTQTVELQKKGLDRIRVFSGAQLKYIAFLSMLIDHVNKALIYPYNNVLFALALSLVTIWIIDTLKIKLEKIPRFLWYLTTVLILAIMCIISLFLSVDYDYHAILIVYFLYVFYNKPILSCVFGYLSIFKEVWELLGFGFILMYNGKRGRQNKMINYWFYPVHILILGILRMVFNI